MPRATVSTDTVRRDLQSCPEGFVVLRPLSYGQKLSRGDQAMQMVVKNETGPRRRGQKQSAETEIKMLQKAATLLDFRNCVVDHNLTDEFDQKLDLGNATVFESLDPRIGEEIGTLIDELNNFEPASEDAPEGEVGNSEQR